MVKEVVKEDVKEDVIVKELGGRRTRRGGNETTKSQVLICRRIRRNSLISHRYRDN